MKIKTKEGLKREINIWFESRNEFMDSFRKSQGKIDKTKLSKHLSGKVGLTTGWLNAYNIFFNKHKDNFLLNNENKLK